MIRPPSTKMAIFLDRFGIKLKNRSALLDILIIIFGMGSWIVVNGLYNQLALLVRDAPEGWSLPSYMNISTQLGNIGVLIYLLLKKCCRINARYCIYFMMLITCGATVILAFNYKVTFAIGGKSYSLVLHFMLFVISLYGCTSNVMSYPYLKTFRSIYVTSYFVGEGMSLLLPSAVSLIQGVNKESSCNATIIKDDDVLFGTKEYMFFLLALMCLSFLSFMLLNNLKICKEERFASIKDIAISSTNNQWDLQTMLLLVLMTILAFLLYGIHPSLKSYSTLPYGYKAYHLAIVLGDAANPIICMIPLFLEKISNRFISINLFIGFASTAYVILTAVQSPHPILVGTDLGMILVVIGWILAPGCLHLAKLIIATKFRDKGDSWMSWCGAIMQLGSSMGSITGFLIVYYDLLVGNNAC